MKDKARFRTILYTEMDKLDMPADIQGFNFDKIWQEVEQQLKQARVDENQFWIDITKDDITNIDFKNRIKELKGE